MHFETYFQMNRNPIAADFAAGKEGASSRFDLPSPYAGGIRIWRERADWLASGNRPSADRAAVAAAVLAYNRKHNDVPEAIRNAERLKEPGAFVVVGGQQAGLFTGPILAVYKAMTIVRTAKIAEAELGRPVVPVFWIAGEDHDWDEANHTYLVTQQLEARKLSIAHPETAKRTSVSRTSVSLDDWLPALQALEESLPNSEFKPELMDAIRKIAEESRSLSDAFAKTMSLLLGRQGLVLVDSDDERLRSAEAPFFRALLKNRKELSKALRQGEQAVTSLGFPLQAESAPDCCNLFLFHDGERKLLYESGDGNVVTDRKGTVRRTFDELMELCDQEPAAFSNNALTRPLMQEYIFPVLATVLGPSEIAYWSTLLESFHLFGQRTPILIPRQEYTLLEGTVQKQMAKYGVTFDDAWRQFDERREQWLESQDAYGLTAKFDEVKAEFENMYRPLIESAASVNAGLGKLGETNIGKIIEQIDFMKNKAADAAKQQHEAGLRQWERIRVTVAPLGKPQERVVNVFQYVNRYGFAWLEQLLNAAPLDFSDGYRPHEIVYL